MRTQLILLTALISLFLACSESPKSPNTEISEVLIKNSIAEALNNKSTFKLNNQKDTLILGKNGTKIKIEENSFVDSIGQPVNEKIDLVIKEVTKVNEMIHENISTITDNGLLETKGMMKIEAYSDGKKLNLSKGKSLDVFFPVIDEKESNANLYYGIENDQNIIEWEVADDLIKEEVYGNKYITDISIKYRLVEDLDNKNATFKNRKDGHELLKEVLTFSEAEQEKLLNDYIRVYWILFDDGDLEVYAIEGNISEQRKTEIERKLNSIPFIKPFDREGDVADMNGVIDITFFENKGYEDANKFYQLSVSKLGWMNCDVFIEFDLPKIDLHVNTDPETDVKILFENYDTIITAYRKNGKTYFSNIPDKEPIKIIAIKYDKENKRALYSITESIVQENINELEPFETLSLMELKDKIETLN